MPVSEVEYVESSVVGYLFLCRLTLEVPEIKVHVA